MARSDPRRHWCSRSAFAPHLLLSTLCPNPHTVLVHPTLSRSHSFQMFFTVFPRNLRCGIFTTRRLQQTAVSCKRSICNKASEFEKVLPRRIVPNTVQQVPSFCQYLVHLHRDFHRNKESTMNLANSTMKKKNFVPIVGFCESTWALVRLLLLFCIKCCKVDNACLKSGLCVTRTVLEPCLFE